MTTPISMWSRGARECVLVVGDDSIELALLEQDNVIRRTAPISGVRALELSDAWKLSWDQQIEYGQTYQSARPAA